VAIIKKVQNIGGSSGPAAMSGTRETSLPDPSLCFAMLGSRTSVPRTSSREESIMVNIVLAGKEFELDEDGFIQNPELWDEKVAESARGTDREEDRRVPDLQTHLECRSHRR